MVHAAPLVQNVEMEAKEMIEEFLDGDLYAVAGAYTDRGKYGNKVFRCYQQAGKQVIPLNPRAEEVEGVACVRDVSELPADLHGLSVITPPRVTEAIVEEAGRAALLVERRRAFFGGSVGGSADGSALLLKETEKEHERAGRAALLVERRRAILGDSGLFSSKTKVENGF